MVTNNYRASGGGHFPGIDGSNIVHEDPSETREIIAQYLKAQSAGEPGGFSPAANNNWYMKALPANVMCVSTRRAMRPRPLAVRSGVPVHPADGRRQAPRLRHLPPDPPKGRVRQINRRGEAGLVAQSHRQQPDPPGRSLGGDESVVTGILRVEGVFRETANVPVEIPPGRRVLKQR